MINVPVPTQSYRIYELASRRIARRLGPKAPSADALIRHELSLRDPSSVAHEYEDFLREQKRRRDRPVKPVPR